MDQRTMQYSTHRPRHANPIVVLEIDDVELVEVVEESTPRGWRGHRFPPAISDWELSRLVDECTSELCQLGAHRYGAYANAQQTPSRYGGHTRSLRLW